MANGLQFNPIPQPPAEQTTSLPGLLSALAGLGLNVAGAITGKGPVGEDALFTSRMFQNEENQQAQQDFQRAQQQAQIQGSEALANSLAPTITQLPASLQDAGKSLLENRDPEKYLSLLRGVQSDARTAKQQQQTESRANDIFLRSLQDEAKKQIDPGIEATTKIAQDFLPRIGLDNLSDKDTFNATFGVFNKANKLNLSAKQIEAVRQQLIDTHSSLRPSLFDRLLGQGKEPSVQDVQSALMSSIPADQLQQSQAAKQQVQALEELRRQNLPVSSALKAQVSNLVPQRLYSPSAKKFFLKYPDGRVVPE